MVVLPLAHPLSDRREGFPMSSVLLHSRLQIGVAERVEMRIITTMSYIYPYHSIIIPTPVGTSNKT